MLQEEIARAARAVERSIEDGQPVAFAHHKPVTDLLNEVGAGDWSALQGGAGAAPFHVSLHLFAVLSAKAVRAHNTCHVCKAKLCAAAPHPTDMFPCCTWPSH